MRIGVPYATTTVALLLVGAAYVLGQARLDRPARRPSPAPTAPPALRPGPPPARHLLDRATALGLTADQTARLEVLDRGWREESLRLEGAAAGAREQFERFSRDAGAKGASFDEIQRQSDEFRELSATLRERRQRHAEAAQAVLSETQRRSLNLAAGPSTNLPGGPR